MIKKVEQEEEKTFEFKAEYVNPTEFNKQYFWKFGYLRLIMIVDIYIYFFTY